MRFISTLAIAASLLAMPTESIAGEDHGQPHAIILIGADWCAPCVGELRELPVLARAAAPVRLVLAWTDRPARLPPDSSQLGVSQVSQATAREMLVRYGEGNAGLPLAVALRADGVVCARLREGLNKDRLAALLKRCGNDG